MIEIGESIVGAYLRQVRGCELVLYNERTDNQGEIDVIGIRGGAEPQVWLCEVATHIVNLGYGSFEETQQKIAQKVKRAFTFAGRVLPDHAVHVEFWAPSVSVGQVTQWMAEYAHAEEAEGRDVQFVINALYANALQELIDRAAATSAMPSEPAFRLLQILTHVKGGVELPAQPAPGGGQGVRYLVVTGDEVSQPLAKNRAVLAIIRGLFAAGVSLADVRHVIGPARLRVVPGELAGADLWSELAQAHALEQKAQWFVDDPIHLDGSTLVLQGNVWGPDTEARMAQLCALAQNAVSFSVA